MGSPKRRDITTYLVNMLLKTSDVVMEHKAKKALVKSFINPELCEITEDLVLTEPYNDVNKRNLVFEKNTAFVKEQLYDDKALHLEVGHRGYNRPFQQKVFSLLRRICYGRHGENGRVQGILPRYRTRRHQRPMRALS